MRLKAHFVEQKFEGGLHGAEQVTMITFAVVGFDNGADAAVKLEMRPEPYILSIEDETAEGEARNK